MKERERRKIISDSIIQLRNVIPLSFNGDKLNQVSTMTLAIKYIRSLQERIIELEAQGGVGQVPIQTISSENMGSVAATLTSMDSKPIHHQQQSGPGPYWYNSSHQPPAFDPSMMPNKNVRRQALIGETGEPSLPELLAGISNAASTIKPNSNTDLPSLGELPRREALMRVEDSKDFVTNSISPDPNANSSLNLILNFSESSGNNSIPEETGEVGNTEQSSY
eukprot:TRINITY_DN3110_c0_g1_i2.p1 TRINITY_DN3110_c0_g1~~TRINITY_DN3110_c0_g1_i2.p1  ORF type:complete len:222 (-),score=34.11 TRINITY_DN3110_c0_g1_i2:143-808(-)